MTTTSKFNEILDQIDNLHYAEQEMLIDIVKNRLIESRRDEIDSAPRPPILGEKYLLKSPKLGGFRGH